MQMQRKNVAFEAKLKEDTLKKTNDETKEDKNTNTEKHLEDTNETKATTVEKIVTDSSVPSRDSIKTANTTRSQVEIIKPDKGMTYNKDRLNKLILEYLEPDSSRRNQKPYSLTTSYCSCCAKINLANRLKRLSGTGGFHADTGDVIYPYSSFPSINHSTKAVKFDRLTDDVANLSKSLQRMEDSVQRMDEQLEQLSLREQQQQQRTTRLDDSWSKQRTTPEDLNRSRPVVTAKYTNNNNNNSVSKSQQQALPELATDHWRQAAMKAKKYPADRQGPIKFKRSEWPWEDQEL